MAKSALTRPQVRESHDRSAADTSALRLFHSHAGFLDMVYCEPFIKGSKVVINRKTFTRSAQVTFPAFVDCKEYFDWFKVPIRYLWSKWLDWDTNINDANSSFQSFLVNGVLDNSLPTNVPRHDFCGIMDFILSNFSASDMPGHYTGASADFMTMATNALRLLERAGIKHSYKSFDGSSDVPNVCNLFKLAAYQKIYYDHYRNSTYESNDPFAYNLDWLYSGGVSPNTSAGLLLDTGTNHTYVLKKLLTGRYVNWNNDFFHNIYPSLNYSVSTPTGLTWNIPSSVMYRTLVNGNTNTLASITRDGGQIELKSPVSADGAFSFSTVQQIRAAFALDKLMRASAYAPKHVREQIKARWGVDVGDKVSYESERIGSFVSDVQFGEVTQTVDTNAGTPGAPSTLGAVGGKGVGSSSWGKDIHTYCEEDCLIVGIHYYVPTALYDFVQQEWNQKLIREDFFQPEFQNLGLRPILRKNIVPFISFGSAQSPYLNDILGYTVPNQLYKVGQDLNFGMFNTNYYEFFETGGVYNIRGTSSPLSAFVTHVNNLYRNLTLNWLPAYDYFKVLPSSLDSIFAESFDGTYKKDQFYGMCRCKVARVHNMDVHGQPSL